MKNVSVDSRQLQDYEVSGGKEDPARDALEAAKDDVAEMNSHVGFGVGKECVANHTLPK